MGLKGGYPLPHQALPSSSREIALQGPHHRPRSAAGRSRGNAADDAASARALSKCPSLIGSRRVPGNRSVRSNWQAGKRAGAPATVVLPLNFADQAATGVVNLVALVRRAAVNLDFPG